MSKLDVGQKTQQKRLIKNLAYNSTTDTHIRNALLKHFKQ